jgi:hypothetical protein
MMVFSGLSFVASPHDIVARHGEEAQHGMTIAHLLG